MKKNNLTLIIIALAIADLLGAIDATGVNIALPTITRDLSIPIVIAQWIPNAYTLVLVSMLIFMGRLGDIIGVKKLYIYGLLIFGISSIFLGFVENTSALIAIRAIQGLGTAILYTMPIAIIAHLWKEREKAFAVMASFFAGGMLVGPLIGGLLTGLNIGQFHGWHLIFLMNIPFVIFGLIIASKYIPKIQSKMMENIDYLSAALLFSGLILIVLSLSVISRYFLILGVALLLVLYFYEKNIKSPLLDIELFKNRTFTAANLISFFAMVTMIGMSFVLTFYFQDVLGWTSTKAGLAFLPIPIATGIFSAIGGKIKSWKLGGFLSSGLILAGIFLLAFTKPSISYFSLILPGTVLISAGSGILMTVLFAAIIGSAPTDKSGHASGILNTIQQLASLIGIAIVASIVMQYKLSFSILVITAFAGLISAFFIKNVQESKKMNIISK